MADEIQDRLAMRSAIRQSQARRCGIGQGPKGTDVSKTLDSEVEPYTEGQPSVWFRAGGRRGMA